MAQLTFDSLYHINAAGCTPSSLYTAVANKMLFSKPSKALIRCDISLDAPYIFVEIEELAQLDRATRCILMLSHLLEQIDIATLRQTERISQMLFLLPVDELAQPVIADEILNELLNEYIPEQIPAYTQMAYCDLTQLSNDTLVIAVDSCVSYQFVSEQAKHTTVQVLNGPPGVINGEGGYALLVHPQGSLNAHIYEGALCTQLTQANCTSQDSYIFAGDQSLAWQKKWYANTQKLYQQGQPLIESAELVTTLGFQGTANILAALTLAQSYLCNPLTRTLEQVFAIFNAPNEQLVKISRSEN
ncbi:hypothetical protein RC083_02280 [Pseudoalteromonas haloplanktis]|uniref:Uncharacterized protein n=1 Tax=Pseudoalteromonas haloplanktis TaxID=228 RepID=A0ABU1B9V9_PSEHA|nr:hypothetical protein [Pseudoalteromonas haloplanktis]MDQ9090417.1 hypothetical protein [Pseudoalteromonas haloplanktis]